MKKEWIKRIICGSLVLAILSGSLWYLNQVLVLKRNDGITTMKDFYAQQEDTIDVLLLGSSHSGMNLDSETFWSEYGISSFALWGSVQPFWNSYFFLVEALKTQTPKVVVLDVYAATQTLEYSDDARQVTNIAGMKLSANKLNAIRASAPRERWLNLLTGFPIYHKRYSELTENDFEHFPWSENQINNKGTGVRYGTGNYPIEDVSSITEFADIHPKEEQYLRKIIDLCKTVQIPLVLVTTPTVPSKTEQPYYNTVAKIAQEEDVSYYNFNLMSAAIGFESDCFWTDKAHLNTKGARLITEYLARELKDTYQLEDHRGDVIYHSWEVNASNLNTKYLKLISNTQDYFRELKQTGNAVFLVKNSSWEPTENYIQLINSLTEIGADYETLMNSGGGDWLIPGTLSGEFHNQYFGDLYSEFQFDDQTFTADFKNGTGLSINGETLYHLNGPGIICIIYDAEANACVDIVTFLQKEDFALRHIDIP